MSNEVKGSVYNKKERSVVKDAQKNKGKIFRQLKLFVKTTQHKTVYNEEDERCDTYSGLLLCISTNL